MWLSYEIPWVRRKVILGNSYPWWFLESHLLLIVSPLLSLDYNSCMVLVFTFLFFVWECLNILKMWWICCILLSCMSFFQHFAGGGYIFIFNWNPVKLSHEKYFLTFFSPFLCFVLQLLEWGHLWAGTCPWCLGPQWWDLLLVLWWCPLGQEWLGQTDKERGAPLSTSFLWLVLVHQESVVLWLWVFSNSVTRKTHSLFLSKRE